MFHVLKSIFLPRQAKKKTSQRGRKCNLPEIPVLNNKLLLQILLLKKEGRSYDDASAFLHKLFPGIKESTLRYYLTNLESKVSHHEVENFLQETYATTTNPVLSERGIDCNNLDSETQPIIRGDCSLLLELLEEKKKKEKTFQDLCLWWNNLTGHMVDMKSMQRKCASVSEKSFKLKKPKHLQY